MPYRRKYRGKRRKRRFRRKRSSAGKKLLRDARTRGINSAAERAVQIIAKREALKLIGPNLIFRREIYAAAPYNRVTNVFAAGTNLGLAGHVLHMCQIPVWDIVTQAAVAPTADTAFPTPDYGRGPNTLTQNIPQDGYRESTTITIKNLSAQLRLFLPASAESRPNAESVTVEFAIVKVQDADAGDLQWKPDLVDIMPWKGYGWSSRLDTEADPMHDMKFRYLARKRVRMKYREWLNNEVYTKLFWSGSIRYEYQGYDPTAGLVLDQNGQRVVGNSGKIFLIMRSSIPEVDVELEGPTVQGFIKVGYRNGA